MALEFSKAYQRKQPQAPAPSAPPSPSTETNRRSIYASATSPPGTKPEEPAASAPARKRAGREEKRPAREEKRPAREEGSKPSRAPRAPRPAPEATSEDELEPAKAPRRRRRRAGAAEEARQESARLDQARAEEVPDDAHYGGAFREFFLSGPVLKAIEELGWQEPSEIQRAMIPRALLGRDVVGQARTGTGKTGAFAIPVVERYQSRAKDDPRGRLPAVLVLTPTRELALQIEGQFEHLTSHTRLRCVCVYGGAPLEPQLRALRAGSDVVVGTPGRVMDHVRRGTLRLDEISCFVLDEADRMFDLGFRDDIYWISRRLPKEHRQTLLLSATMPDEILRLAKEVTADPEVIRTAPADLTVTTIEQFYVSVDPERKLELLQHLVEQEQPEKGIVFTRTKRGANKVTEKLRHKGFDAGEIHGDLRQKMREKILERFREGNLHLLVATDVAARGLDIQGVSHIFNYDVPENPEDYVHRVGRTARMGKSGRAFTFVTLDGGSFLTEIEKLINKEVPRYEPEGFRCLATDEEKAGRERRGGGSASTHPMAEKLSPALLALLQKRKGPGGRGGGGGGRGGGGGDRGRGGRSGGGGRGGGRRGR